MYSLALHCYSLNINDIFPPYLPPRHWFPLIFIHIHWISIIYCSTTFTQVNGFHTHSLLLNEYQWYIAPLLAPKALIFMDIHFGSFRRNALLKKSDFYLKSKCLLKNPDFFTKNQICIVRYGLEARLKNEFSNLDF